MKIIALLNHKTPQMTLEATVQSLYDRSETTYESLILNTTDWRYLTDVNRMSTEVSCFHLIHREARVDLKLGFPRFAVFILSSLRTEYWTNI